jgi:predicted RNA-binding Zn-ribbon protein involved in translation (DUF1610 family)
MQILRLESTSQYEDQDPRDVSTSVRSRSDSGFEAAASREVSYNTMDASLSVTGQRKASYTHGCPLCGDLHLMRCQKFLCKVPI